MKNGLPRFFRRALRQGTWPLLQRYSVAPKVMSLPPIEVAAESNFTVHVRVCEGDAMMLHWAVRSLFHHSSQPFQLAIHDDGSCRPSTLAKFRSSFVNCKVYSREDALRLIEPKLASFGELGRWRRSSYTGIKWIDFFLLGRSKFVIFLDSDVLFFKDPVGLFEKLDAAVWMKDCFNSLYFRNEEAARWYDVTQLPQLNSGLGRIPRDWFDAALAQDVLKRMSTPEIAKRAVALGLPINDDQTFNAVLTARGGPWDYLSDDYQLAMEPGLARCVARHYVGSRRFGFFEEGMPRVATQLGLKLAHWQSERA